MEIRSFDQLPEGEIIRRNVLGGLVQNSLLKEEDIQVDIVGHEVILMGVVDSLDKKWLAEDIASDTFGVLHVTNNIDLSDGDRSLDTEDFYEG